MANLAGSVLICKRLYHELDPHQAEYSDCLLVSCQDCETPVYAMRKNLGRGLIILCKPCAFKRIAEEKDEPVVFIPGKSIGSKDEDKVHEIALELEQSLRRDY